MTKTLIEKSRQIEHDELAKCLHSIVQLASASSSEAEDISEDDCPTLHTNLTAMQALAEKALTFNASLSSVIKE